MTDVDRANVLIRDLRLTPHPEGGFYREISRSTLRVMPADGRPSRAAVTTIYFLLVFGTYSRWHRVASDEVWHFYEGDPLELVTAAPDASGVEMVKLGALDDGGHRVHTVSAGRWQAARPLGRYALVGCTVAPGFEFEDFAFMRDDVAAATTLRSTSPEWAGLL